MFTWYTKTQIITLSQIIKQIAWLVSAVSKVQRLAEVCNICTLRNMPWLAFWNEGWVMFLAHAHLFELFKLIFWHMYILGCRQKMKIFPGALFGMDSTQGSIWRPFFCRPTSFYLTTRAFYAAPLAASSWNPPVRTVLASTSEIQLRIGIFGWFSHILYKILPRSQRTFQIQNSLPL